MDLSYKDKCKEELADFLEKMEYEGGVAQIIYHSGTSSFPRALQPSARIFQKALLQMESDIDTYAEGIGL